MRLKTLAARVLRKMGFLPTPMEVVLRELNRRGVNLAELDALEAFGYKGYHTKDYAPFVKSLEVWEIYPGFEKDLRNNFPNARIRICDSFKQILATERKYDLIVVDNPASVYGENNAYCEHFELFPNIFRAAKNECIVILAVIPNIVSYHKTYGRYPSNEQLERRAKFYNTNHPERLGYREMVVTYEQYASDNGFSFDWYFTVKRTAIYNLVFKITKR